MRIVFWQNCLSPHQLPYIVHLIKDERVSEVVVVAECITNEERKNMGWDVTSLVNLKLCKMHIMPTEQEIDDILRFKQEDSYHLFSGIRGFKFVFNIFLNSLKYNIQRGLITERPNTFAFGMSNGKALWMHRIRFIIQDRKFISYIHSVFAIGEDAVIYYKSLSNKWKVFPFAYCTQEHITKGEHKNTNAENASFIFIGSLSWWKATIDILKAYKLIFNSFERSRNSQITIIGDGPERAKLEKYVSFNKLAANIDFKGTKKNSEIPTLLEQQDCLILPSIYDGWGAVINEALQKGLYVICSDQCGAKELLSDPRCGSVFRGGNNKQLAQIIQKSIEEIEEIRRNREFRIKWAHQCISGEAISKYMIDCLIKGQRSKPWII